VDEVQADKELRLAIRQAPHFVRVPDFSEEGGGHWRTGDRSTTFGGPMVDDRCAMAVGRCRRSGHGTGIAEPPIDDVSINRLPVNHATSARIQNETRRRKANAMIGHRYPLSAAAPLY
jgi:hypothetical protein